MKVDQVPNKASISLDNDGILCIKMLPESSILEEDAVEICRVAAVLSGDVIHCNLVDVTEMLFMDKKARAVFGSQRKSTVPAVAIVSNSKIQKSLVNLYLAFSRPSTPTKAFNNVIEARNWLLINL